MQRENAAAKRHLHYAFSAHAPQAIVNPLSFMVVYKRCTCGFTIYRIAECIRGALQSVFYSREAMSRADMLACPSGECRGGAHRPGDDGFARTEAERRPNTPPLRGGLAKNLLIHAPLLAAGYLTYALRNIFLGEEKNDTYSF